MADSPDKLNKKAIPWVYQGQKDTVVTRFFKKVQYYVQGEKVERQLRERKISELEVKAEDILRSLVNIKQELQSSIDPSLYTQVEAVIDPIIREVNQFQRLQSKDDTVVVRYNTWIEKATSWVDICSALQDKETLKEALVRHIANESNQIIEGDLRVISDYLNNALSSLVLKDEERKALEEGVGRGVAPHVMGLQQLMIDHFELPFEQIGTWRRSVAHQREQFFNNALHTIDELIADLPSKDSCPKVSHMKNEVETLFLLLDHDMEDADRRISMEQHLTMLEHDLDLLSDEAPTSDETKDRLRRIRTQIDSLLRQIEDEKQP